MFTLHMIMNDFILFHFHGFLVEFFQQVVQAVVLEELTESSVVVFASGFRHYDVAFVHFGIYGRDS